MWSSETLRGRALSETRVVQLQLGGGRRGGCWCCQLNENEIQIAAITSDKSWFYVTQAGQRTMAPRGGTIFLLLLLACQAFGEMQRYHLTALSHWQQCCIKNTFAQMLFFLPVQAIKVLRRLGINLTSKWWKNWWHSSVHTQCLKTSHHHYTHSHTHICTHICMY